MQLIDFRKDTCEVYIGAYYGQDCNNPESEAQWVVTHYFVDGGVIKAEQVKYIAWDDRETATYSPHNIDQGNVPAVVLDNLINCSIKNFDYEKLILCHPIDGKVLVESWTNIADPLQTATRRYTILATGLEYTGDVSELEDCGAEKYDIVLGGDYCDGGIDLTRFDVFDLTTNTIASSYFVNTSGTVVTPVNPIKGLCPAPALGLAHTNTRASGTNTYSSPYRSISITAISDDVLIDGQLLLKGMTVSYGTNQNEYINTNTVVTGTDYFITLLQ